MHLLVSLASCGWHPAARHVSGTAGFEGAAPFKAAARTAERAGIDAVLVGFRDGGLHLDPLPLLGALIGATRTVGLCAYWPCDVAEPYHVARVFATLDHLAGGRTGWIAGLAGPEALAGRFQRLDLPTDEADAAARMVEMVDVARLLWDSWEEKAFVVDQASGTFADSGRVRPINHRGRFFTVRGPLNVPRPVQGQPVILYRDSLPDIARAGMAGSAEVVLAEPATLVDATAARSQWRALAGKHGRDPDSLRFIARVMPILAASEAEAEKRAADLDTLAPANALPRFVGTPESFARSMAAWIEAEACDGFDLLPAVMTTDLGLIADAVVPSLRKLGLRTSGRPSPELRGTLGLRHVDSRFAA